MKIGDKVAVNDNYKYFNTNDYISEASHGIIVGIGADPRVLKVSLYLHDQFLVTYIFNTKDILLVESINIDNDHNIKLNNYRR